MIRMCPCCPTPVLAPIRAAKASRAAIPLAAGHGWPGLQVPSNSRAAMPASLKRGPSSHQTGPSPCHTCVGVQTNVWPDGITGTLAVATDVEEKITAMLIRVRHSGYRMLTSFFAATSAARRRVPQRAGNLRCEARPLLCPCTATLSHFHGTMPTRGLQHSRRQSASKHRCAIDCNLWRLGRLVSSCSASSFLSGSPRARVRVASGGAEAQIVFRRKPITHEMRHRPAYLVSLVRGWREYSPGAALKRDMRAAERPSAVLMRNCVALHSMGLRAREFSCRRSKATTSHFNRPTENYSGS